ncbi:hypothetical protein CUR178_04021 [Leishmania enriettii]|uniref:Uncharacterized protein n=1 Tax=Leishmania enriettii TaxID=5663 RepID=A0A836H3C7_LEIEN|nr:hypothetical protein CUR178_04021 [Leishmania enriettii]
MGTRCIAWDANAGFEGDTVDAAELSTSFYSASIAPVQSTAEGGGCRGCLRRCSIDPKKVDPFENWRNRSFISRCGRTALLAWGTARRSSVRGQWASSGSTRRTFESPGA